MKSMNVTFTRKFMPVEFTPTEHSTAEEKAEFANHFVRFVMSSYDVNLFTKKFYQRLSMCFYHTAHFSQGGFYETFFTSLEGQLEFADITENTRIVGDPRFTYSDVEQALQEWSKDFNMLEIAQTALNNGIEASERLEYARLKNKYG